MGKSKSGKISKVDLKAAKAELKKAEQEKEEAEKELMLAAKLDISPENKCRPMSTYFPFKLDKPFKFETYDQVVEFCSWIIHQQLYQKLSVTGHKSINGTLQVMLKAFELRGHYEEIEQLREDVIRLRKNLKKRGYMAQPITPTDKDVEAAKPH